MSRSAATTFSIPGRRIFRATSRPSISTARWTWEIDAEATVETVADGMAPHPTLAEAFKEAGLVALGRPIHVAARRRS